MPSAFTHRTALISTLAGLVLGAVFAVLVFQFAGELRQEVRDKMIARAAELLQPMGQRQLDERCISLVGPVTDRTLQDAFLSPTAQEGLISMAVFNADGALVFSVPSDQGFVDLPVDDFVELSAGHPISRLRSEADVPGLARPAAGPTLEVLVPLHGAAGNTSRPGFLRYVLDARRLSAEISIMEQRIRRQAQLTLLFGLVGVAVVMAAAVLALRRAQRLLQERSARLLSAQGELSLAAKASAVGQLTANLMHGLKGAVAGLRAATAGGGQADVAAVDDYTRRVDLMIQDTLEVLSDGLRSSEYQVPGGELLRLVLERNEGQARERGVTLETRADWTGELDNHRANLAFLIANNLVRNAVQASPSGGTVRAGLCLGLEGRLELSVCDQGDGVPALVRERLFQAGVSGRPGGSGLGLALSRLLAHQMGGELALAESSASGSRFVLSFPLEPVAPVSA
jgi:signal transduction histidine kinase